MSEKEARTTGTPRWVKVFGIVALLLLVLVVVMLVTGRGGHGPGRHTPAGETTSSLDSGGHSPPTGTHRQP